MQTVIVPVTGMSCGGCVNSVTSVLTALPGVVRVTVSLDDAQAEISYDETRVDLTAIRQAILDAGFGVGQQD